MVDVDDEAPPQHPPPATMSEPHPAPNPPPHQFANNRTLLPDIRPICALADAAEAVSRIAMNGGITRRANDNDNAAILASLSTSTAPAPPSLLPHPRGGNVVSPTTQLFSSCYECTTATIPSSSSSLNGNTNSMNTTTKQQSKTRKLCSVPICTNIVIRAGVCVTHGAKLFVCQIEGCTRTAIGDQHLCVAHAPKPKCDIPGCSMSVAKSGAKSKCKMHYKTRCHWNGCVELVCIGSYCQHHCTTWTNNHQPPHFSMHDHTSLTSGIDCRYENTEKVASALTNNHHFSLHAHTTLTSGMEYRYENTEKAASDLTNNHHHFSTHDNTSLTSGTDYCYQDSTETQASVGRIETERQQLTSSLDVLCSVSIQSLLDDEEVSVANQDATKPPPGTHSSSKPRRNCGKCEACVRDDCGVCKPCLDKPKFGGRNKMRRRCCERKCLNTEQKIEMEAVVEEIEQQPEEEEEEHDESEATSFEEIEEEGDVATELPESQVSKPRRIDYRRGACGTCEPCLRDDCGKCKPCLDKLKFGGKNRLKQKCSMRVCLKKQDKLDEESVVTKDSSKLDSKGFADEVKTTSMPVDDTEYLNSWDDDMLGSNVFFEKVKTKRDDGRSEGKRMKAELAKIKAELDAKANGKQYGLKPPEYPTFNYSAADGDEDDVEVQVGLNEVYLSSDEDDEMTGDDSSDNVYGSDELIDSSSYEHFPSTGVERGVTIRPSGKWQVQLYYAGSSRYIGLFGTREEACTAYVTARDCMNSFGDMDPSPTQIKRNLDKLRKAAVSGGEVGAKRVKRSNQFADLKEKTVNPTGDTGRPKSDGETSSLNRQQPGVTTKAKSTKVAKAKSANKGSKPSSIRSTSIQAVSRNPHEYDLSEASSTKNGRSPSRSSPRKTNCGDRAKSDKNGGSSPKPLFAVQPEASKAKDGSSLMGFIQKESLGESPKRKSLSSIYEKAMKLAEELPRGITVRPSGKWQVQVYYEGKSRYLGVFKSKLDAAVGYELARACCSSFEENPSEEQAKKNVILMRKAAFTVETGDMEPKPIKNKKQKTT